MYFRRESIHLNIKCHMSTNDTWLHVQTFHLFGISSSAVGGIKSLPRVLKTISISVTVFYLLDFLLTATINDNCLKVVANVYVAINCNICNILCLFPKLEELTRLLRCQCLIGSILQECTLLKAAKQQPRSYLMATQNVNLSNYVQFCPYVP